MVIYRRFSPFWTDSSLRGGPLPTKYGRHPSQIVGCKGKNGLRLHIGQPDYVSISVRTISFFPEQGVALVSATASLGTIAAR